MKLRKLDEKNFGFNYGVDYEQSTLSFYFWNLALEIDLPFKNEEEKFYGALLFKDTYTGSGFQVNYGANCRVWSW